MNAKKTSAPAIDIGISAGERKKIAQGLSALLADSYTLYLMTHNFHRRITRPKFDDLHQMVIQQYNDQWAALDSIAERIPACPGDPGRSRHAAALSRQPPSVRQMELTLARAGLIRRRTGAARIIELFIAPQNTPILRWLQVSPSYSL